jgi:hypothetical protein
MKILSRSEKMSVHRVHDAIAIPVVQISDDVMKFGIYNSDGSLCVPALHLKDTGSTSQFEDIPVDNDKRVLPLLHPGIYGGLFFNHFGHFLVESIGRLWAVNGPDPEMASLPIYVFELWGKINLGDEQHFVSQILRLLGVDIGRIITIDEPSIISMLVIPQQKYGWHLIASPPADFVRFLFNAQTRVTDMVKRSTLLPRRVYVSRALIDPSRGKVAGEQQFERFLEEHGYQTFYPEQYPLTKQVEIYANAEKLIFCEGSAVHACILLPCIQADIAVILRRKESDVTAQFSGVGKKVSVIQAILKHRSLGLPTWHGVTTVDYFECSRLLRDEGFVSGFFDRWGAVRQKEEEAALTAYVRAVAEDHRLLFFLQVAEPMQTSAEARLEAVLSSTSWRVTAPLRRMVTLAKGSSVLKVVFRLAKIFRGP